MDKILIEAEKIETEITICHQQLSYWEEQYRNTPEGVYKKSYWRQINRLQSKLETLEWIKAEGEERN